MRILYSLAFLALPLTAQEFQFNLPMTGAVFQASDRSIRLVLGVPGAAYLSDPVLEGLDGAFIAPNGARALVLKDGQLLAARDLQANASIEASAAWPGCADLVQWSEDSAAAAVYCRASGALQLFRWTPSSAAPEVQDLDASSVTGRLNAIAVDPRGRFLAAAFESAGVWRLQPGEPPRLLASLASPSALAVHPAGDSIFVANREACQVVEVRNAAGEPDISIFASLAEPVCDPSAIAFAGRGSGLLLTDATARTVRVFDLRGGVPADSIALDFSPTTLAPLVSGSVFLLNSAKGPDEPLYVWNAAKRAAFFLPAGRRQ
jgi:hypothetical protein